MAEDVRNKIEEIRAKIAEKMKERAEAAESGGWHDNAGFDAINDEISILEDRLRSLLNQ